MLPILQGSLITVGPWFSVHGRKGLRVYPFQRGGVVKTASTSTTITMHDSGDIAANDYIMVCAAASYGEDNVWTPAVTKVALVTDVTSNVLTISGSGLTVAVGDYILCLGVDTGGTAPNYDGSDITLYDDPVGTTASSYDYLVTGSSSGFIGWVNRGTVECDVLVTDSANVPLSLEIAKPVLQQRVDYTYRGTRPTLTIDTGTITFPTAQASSEVIVAAESGTTDTLSTISGGITGDLLYLTADSGDTITVDENGNISLESTVEMTGDLILVLRFDGTSWDEVSYTSAGGGGGGGDSITVNSTGDVMVADVLYDATSAAGAEQEFSLSGISADYDYLEVHMLGLRGRDTGGPTVAALTFNGDSGNNYDYAQHSFGGTSAHTEGNINAAFVGYAPDSNDRAAAVGGGFARIYNHGDGDHSTQVFGIMNATDNVAGDSNSREYHTTWLNDAAVTSMTIVNYTTTTTWADGSRCIILGYKKVTVVTDGSFGDFSITNGLIVETP